MESVRILVVTTKSIPNNITNVGAWLGWGEFRAAVRFVPVVLLPIPSHRTVALVPPTKSLWVLSVLVCLGMDLIRMGNVCSVRAWG